jgi:hypothetical protein
MKKERQIHGFNYQKKVIEKLNLTPDELYTGKWDAYFNNIPISIKNTKLGSDIELADFYRNAEIKEDFILIVGFWKTKKDNIVDTQILYIKHNSYSTLFNKEFGLKAKNLLNSITNNKADDLKWKNEIKTLKNFWLENTDNLIRPRFKRDHKTQKRIQCAINNSDFYNYFIKKYPIMEDLKKWLEILKA